LANTIFIEIEVDDKGSPILKGFADKADKNLKKAGDSHRRFARTASRSISGLTRRFGPLLGVLGLAGLAAGALKAGRAAVNAASMLEDYEVRLVSLRGSQKAATESLEFFRKVASGVPQTFQEVAEAGVTLEAMTGQAKRLLPVSADLATVMGLTLPEAASAFGRAFSAGAGAADIFRERGILNIIKDSAGIEDLTKFTLPEFQEAMLKAFTDPEGKIAGAAQRLTATWTGQLSMLQDAFFDLSANIGKAILPVMKDLVTNHIKPMVKGISDWVKANDELIRQNIENTVKAFQDALSSARKILTPFVQTVKTLFFVALDGWGKLPVVVREVGIVGAIIGGKKAALAIGALVIVIGLIERATKITKKGIETMKAGVVPLEAAVNRLIERQGFLLKQMQLARGNETVMTRLRILFAKTTDALAVAQGKLGDAASLVAESFRLQDEATASLIPTIKEVSRETERAGRISTKAAKLFLRNWEFTAENIIDGFDAMTRADDDFWDNLEKNSGRGTKVFRDNWAFTAKNVQDDFFKMTRAEDKFTVKTRKDASITANAWRSASRSFQSGFSDAIFNTITGRFNSLKDVGISVANALARAFADLLASFAFRFLFGGGGGFGFNFSGGGGGFFGGLLQGGFNAGINAGISSLFGGGGGAAAIGGTAGALSGPGAGAAGGAFTASAGGAGAAGAGAAGAGGGGAGASAAAGSAAAGATVGLIGVGVAAGVAFFVSELLGQKPTPTLLQLSGGNIGRLGSLASFRVFASLPSFLPEQLVGPPDEALGLGFTQQVALDNAAIIGAILAANAGPNPTIGSLEALWRNIFLRSVDAIGDVHPFVSDLVSRITFAAKGFHGLVSRPTLFVAGDAGPERVDISPRGRGRGGDLTIHFSFTNSVISSKRDLLRIIQPSVDIALKRAARSKFQKAAL